MLTHAFINLSKSMVNGCYKKQALASKDEGPAEIGRAAAAGRGRVVLIWRSPRVPPHFPAPVQHPLWPRTQADISEALAPSPPATSGLDAHYLPATQQRNHTPFSCQDRVTGFSNSIYSAIENLSSGR